MGQKHSTSTQSGLQNIRNNNQPSNLKNRIAPVQPEKRLKPILKQNYVGNIDDNNISANNPYNEKEDRGSINFGLNNHQYFKAIPESTTNVNDYVGVSSKKDPRFQQNINNLYDTELNNRDFDLDNINKVVYRKEPIPIDSNNSMDNSLKQVPVYSKNTKNENYKPVQYDNNETSGITITRDDALIIRDIKNFTNLDKRLLIMNNITLQDLDPINVLENNKNITLDELSQKYISFRNIYHPDKGGSSEMFNIVNTSLKKQIFIIKSRVIDKDFNQLKQNFNEYSEKKKKPVEFSNEEILDTSRFSNERFNRFFNDNKYGDDFNDYGYGDMMEKTGEREDIDINKTIDEYNNDSFNNIFNNNKNIVCNKIVEYKVPEPINISSNYKGLGSKMTNFTDTTNILKYCDYNDAYTKENIINVGQVNNRVYKNVEELKKERKNDKLQLSDEMQRIIEENEARINNLEKDRQSASDQFDKNLEIHYHKVNKLMLE